jgi:hypothetical protein
VPRWTPLDWPEGYPRTKERKPSRFRVSFSQALDGVRKELQRMHALNILVSTNLDVARDGWPDPRSRLRNEDPGVAVYWNYAGKLHVIACDAWERVEDNLHSVALTIAADRGKERWGCSAVFERAMTAYVALPPPPRMKDWWEVLGCTKEADIEDVEDLYKIKLKRFHPDAGGSHERMAELNRAIDEARKEKQNVA